MQAIFVDINIGKSRSVYYWLGVRTDDRALLTDIAKRLERLCVHVSVRDDVDGIPFLFAVGLRHVHSLELRRKGEACIVELWRGPPNLDKFIAKVRLHSLKEAAQRCEQWLRNDAT